jgi:membrane protease YdiL (CAAX protease family)
MGEPRMNDGARSAASPWRVLAGFVLALPAAMLLAAVAAPWVQAALAPWQVFPLHRVFSRLTMLGVIVITASLLYRYRLCNRQLLGYQGPTPAFLRHSLLALAAGAGLMLAALLPLFLLDIREWSDRAPQSLPAWSLLALKGLASGLAVALIEETFFRGAMQGALERLGALRLALFAVPVYYAAVHFLGRATSVPYEEVDAFSGFVALRGFFTGYAEPLRIIDAFVALYCVGLLLALVRRRRGGLAGCIGLHAGFVTIIAMFRKVSAPGPEHALWHLVGRFDGLLGWWIAAITALCCIVLWRSSRPRQA